MNRRVYDLRFSFMVWSVLFLSEYGCCPLTKDMNDITFSFSLDGDGGNGVMLSDGDGLHIWSLMMNHGEHTKSEGLSFALPSLCDHGKMKISQMRRRLVQDPLELDALDCFFACNVSTECQCDGRRHRVQSYVSSKVDFGR